MSRHPLSFLRAQIRHEEVVAATSILALITISVPIQHYISLARFQHYGIALYVWSLGFVVQAVWSWKAISKWRRFCLLSTGIYASLLAIIIYLNPWLDPRIQIQTAIQEELRQLYTVLWIAGGLLLAVLWIIWAFEEMHFRSRGKQPKKQ